MGNNKNVKDILQNVKSGWLTIEEAMAQIEAPAFEDIGYAKVDHARRLRQGFAEVIYGAGKTDEQILGIVHALVSRGAVNILVTRIGTQTAQKIAEAQPDIEYNDIARLAWIKPKRLCMGNVLVLSAGTSDMPIAEEAAITAEAMGAKVKRAYDAGVAGLHRLLAHVDDMASSNAIVAVAGMEGALPSVTAGLTDKPVIAVPTSIGYGANMGGISALLAMLNSCSSGVAVVNIDNGFGAGFMAGRINRLVEEGK